VDARVLAPVTATATGHETAEATGLRAESGAELAVLLIEAADGSRALPVFTDVAALRRWRLDARPVVLTGAEACTAALGQGAQHLVIDPAGAAVVLGPAELRTVAVGWVPVAGTALSSRTGETQLAPPASDPPAGLLPALRRALRRERLVSARLLEGPDGLVLGITGRGPLEPTELAALAHRLMGALGPDLPAGGLGVAEVPADGPGLRILRRSWFSRG
jgi:hypothetical protein